MIHGNQVWDGVPFLIRTGGNVKVRYNRASMDHPWMDLGTSSSKISGAKIIIIGLIG